MERNRIQERDYSDVVRKEALSQDHAQNLRSSAIRAADEILQTGQIEGLLDLISRLHYYDIYNLLLIYQQFPRATCLAGYRYWKTLYAESDISKLIKPEWKGKGIDLVAPFYDPDNSMFVWSPAKQYDILQTQVSIDLVAPSIYIQDAGHLRVLLESLVIVTATEYHRSVIRVASSSTLSRAGLPGEMTDVTIMLRDDVKPALQINFLTECLCQLASSPIPGIADMHLILAQQYMVRCLLKIWGLTPIRALQKSPGLLGRIPTDKQIAYLDQIRKVVRALDLSVSAAYRFYREGEHKTNDQDINSEVYGNGY